jgi:hypothetical protein
MFDRSNIPNKYGVYCFFDLNGDPAYVGKSSTVKTRIGQHFESRTSTIAGDQRLDPWDIQEIRIWFIDEINAPAEEHSRGEKRRISDVAEDEIKQYYEPYLNYEGLSGKNADLELDPTTPDIEQWTLPEPDRKFRRHPFNRMQRKLTHVSNLVEIIRSTNNPQKQIDALQEHWRILEESKSEFLQSDDRDFDLREILEDER